MSRSQSKIYSLTLASFAAVYSEVGGFIGFQATFLHTWSIHLHILRVAALSNVHLDFSRKMFKFWVLLQFSLILLLHFQPFHLDPLVVLTSASTVWLFRIKKILMKTSKYARQLSQYVCINFLFYSCTFWVIFVTLLWSTTVSKWIFCILCFTHEWVLTLNGLLGTLTSPQVMIMVCLMGFVGM